MCMPLVPLCHWSANGHYPLSVLCSTYIHCELVCLCDVRISHVIAGINVVILSYLCRLKLAGNSCKHTIPMIPTMSMNIPCSSYYHCIEFILFPMQCVSDLKLDWLSRVGRLLAMVSVCKSANRCAKPKAKVCKTSAKPHQICKTNGFAHVVYAIYEQFGMPQTTTIPTQTTYRKKNWNWKNETVKYGN